MKYYKKIIKEDKKLFKNVNVKKLADLLGISHSYLYRVKSGKYIVSNKQYKRIRTVRKTLDK